MSESIALTPAESFPLRKNSNSRFPFLRVGGASHRFILADDDRMRERIREHSGFRVRVRGTKLPEEPGDEVTRVNVGEIERA
jgi:hypothetical protein